MRTKTLSILLLMALPFSGMAGEGMWIPSGLEAVILNQMKEMGSELTADDIYSTKNPSLKDGVIWFGRGCTGEVISDQGLILTNYHCGYGQIQSHSTVENDYLKNGFWSYTPEEELPCKGLTVSFVVSIKNVTDKILSGISSNNTETGKSTIELRSDSLVKAATAGTHYKGSVKSYFYGNHYYLILMEEFTDIRLVGAPPSSIGKFGGDTDNWVWPRHTGDFSLFRIYANADNKPASYDADNVPYKPRFSFPISLKGINENDFTMVYGFPGRTVQYIPSGAVTMMETKSNPTRVEIRRRKLEIIDKAISSNDTIRLLYASKQQRIANAFKKWQGEMLGTERVNTIGRKVAEEKAFEQWASKNNKQEYKDITQKLNVLYEVLTPYELAYDYTREAIWGVDALRFIKSYFKLEKLALDKKTDSKLMKTEKGVFLNKVSGHFKNYRVELDKAMFTSMMMYSNENMDSSFRPSFFDELLQDGDAKDRAAELFANSVFVDQEKLTDAITNLNYKNAKLLKKDPLYQIAISTYEFDKNQLNPLKFAIKDSIAKLMHVYMKGLLEMNADMQLYPDANSTLRVSFGKVEGFEPKDGLEYKHYTTLAGVIEKEDPLSDEFVVEGKLKQLWKAKDFGQYSVNDTLYVGFIASNHTAGGNSGSPVVNSKGELIGTNFDRVWEGTMSDIEFDPDRCRNISVDIRYTLFIIDKFAGCKRLINEMNIVR
jgi:Peptidase S46